MTTTLVSVVVPAYNAEPYLARALDSLVGFGPSVEILVVDDGSTDGTAALAQTYAQRHPGEVQVISKPNGGHGSAINTGLAHATGLYLKVVDADDWVDRAAFGELLAKLAGFVADEHEVDLVVTNFVYEKVGKRTKTTVRYEGALPVGRTFTWDRTRRFGNRQYLMMHALLYRTQVLRDAGLRLPEHTFYVDSLYATVPLHRVRTLHYLDVDLYRYFIGRPDQSVHEAVMLRRLDQQLRVNQLMLDHVLTTTVTNRRLRRYLLHYVGIICGVSSVLLVREGTRGALAERDRLWSELRAADPWLYRRMRWSAFGQITNLPGPVGRRATVMAYRVAQRAIGFS
ncbi:glycosyltransferase family 2 protein [Sanguibacter sp. HDW7]|uniref:glycosyltransferase family 2 protein n=1 Tax=Sanguibacter sp. HDW7 TaxID=2714931 RepID=UPI00140906E7|nr:glycosyltransferase family 2 protein [Sanguibacter sp. HDW7]QIK82380.1 glycosyltransferase family 2 protein [Sanguibacter sp. HDW7]